jgi:hypothetical protein
MAVSLRDGHHFLFKRPFYGKDFRLGIMYYL